MLERTHQAFKNDPAGTVGMTDGLLSISKEELVSVLRHISNDNNLLADAWKRSARTKIFDKLYLLSGSDNKSGKWNLRLHLYPVGTGEDGAAESPHFHRWTLASKIVWGGYLNTNYDVKRSEQALAQADDKDKFSAYSLEGSDKQSDSKVRTATKLYDAAVTPAEEKIYGRGDIKHFPITTAHGVTTFPGFLGTSMSLALSSAAEVESSIGFEKSANLTSLPSQNYADVQELKSELQKRAVLLQLIDLSDSLHEHLSSKANPTEGEKKHMNDHKEFNYIETSLLPAMAILNMTKGKNTEFGADTIKFLNSQIENIDKQHLAFFTSGNQSDLLEKKLSVNPAAGLSTALRLRAKLAAEGAHQNDSKAA
ncbi:MAG: hypothetical protein V4754_20515 [Pseudomonadota bacterium]